MDKQAGLAGATSSASCCAPPASQSGKAHTTPSCTSLPRPHILCTARQSACHTTNASCQMYSWLLLRGSLDLRESFNGLREEFLCRASWAALVEAINVEEQLSVDNADQSL